MNSPSPARNAFKHGFCSSVYIARENAGHVSRIRQELAETYQPVLPEEFQIIDDLALARFKAYQNQKLMHQRATEEKAQAAAIFASQARTAHNRAVAEWLKDPALQLSFLTADPLGIDHLLAIWAELAEALQTPTCTVSLTQACQAAMALGSHWQIQQIGHRGRLVIGLYLAMHPNPEQQIEHWVAISKGQNNASDLYLPHEIYALAPPADQARTELVLLAAAEIDRLKNLRKAAEKLFTARQDQYVAKSCGLGLNDSARQTEARLFLRYYFAEQNRADKLQTRLEQLGRGLNQHRKEKALAALAKEQLIESLRPEADGLFTGHSSPNTQNRSAIHKLQSDDFHSHPGLDLSNATLLGELQHQPIPDDQPADFNISDIHEDGISPSGDRSRPEMMPQAQPLRLIAVQKPEAQALNRFPDPIARPA